MYEKSQTAFAREMHVYAECRLWRRKLLVYPPVRLSVRPSVYHTTPTVTITTVDSRFFHDHHSVFSECTIRYDSRV